MTALALTRLPAGRPDACRLCGDATWLADPEGPVHPCCARWADELTADRPCLSCEASRARARRTRRNDHHEGD